MAELIKKACFKSKDGVVQRASLYTTLDEVQGQGVSVNTMSDNLIPVEKRKFEGWVAYQGAVVTVTQGVSVPEWGTNEATRIQTAGGTSLDKYYTGINFMPSANTAGVVSLYIKNIGLSNVVLRANGLGWSEHIQPNTAEHFIIQGRYSGTGMAQISVVPFNISDSTDIIVYKPEICIAANAYMKYGEVGDANATAARIKRYDNQILPEKRKFEGWVAYQGAVATVTQNIPVPEWGTTEATRIQTSGGSSDTKFYTGNLPIPPIGTKCALRCLVKNQGTKPMVIATNLGTYVTINIGEAKAVFSNAVGNGSGAFQFLCKTTNIGDNMDIIAYKPELYYSDELNKDWAILSQASIPYGQVAYTTPGTYTFTVPSGVDRVRVSMCGGGSSGGMTRWYPVEVHFVQQAGYNSLFGNIIAKGGPATYSDGAAGYKDYNEFIGRNPIFDTCPISKRHTNLPYGCGGSPPLTIATDPIGKFGNVGSSHFYGQSTYTQGGGGSSGQYIINMNVDVLSNQKIPVTVGQDTCPTSAAANYKGDFYSNPGLVLIEWGGDIK